MSTLDGELLFINEFAVKTLGYESSEKVKSAGVLALYKDPREREIPLGIILKEGRLENYPLEFSSPSGETVHALVSASLEEGVVSGIIMDITELKHTEEKLRRSQDQLRHLASNLQSIREEERKNISREIHDELGQSLTALNIDLTWLGNQLAEDHRSLLDKISSMSKRIDNNIQTVKEIATELRPKVLDDLGLTAAIEWQSQRFQERTGIHCEVTVDPANIVLEQELSTNIFRIFQETLTNITRHANATSVKVHLVKDADRIVLEVIDDGRGIREEDITSPHAIGLLGMRERVYPWNGEVTFRGKKGKGTTVNITIPHKRQDNRP
jgi:signal transduction histidine kinase